MIKKILQEEWNSCQKYERESWGDNIFVTPTNGEVIKQNTYAKLLNLTENENFDQIDAGGKTILDVGCGPTSLLLRTKNFKKAVGVEPLFYSEKVNQEYLKHNIELIAIPAEEMDFTENQFDEVWMYNVLQHTYDPTLILNKCFKYGKTIRIFEWLDIPPHEGHPHEFTQEYFEKTLNLKPNEFKIVKLSTKELVGKAICIVIKKG
jgi:ubiquinone/menaquinone biosynthesis C-methylase UbiE